MHSFSLEFSKDEILHQVGGKIPWRTIIEIMSKSTSHEEMLWYINETHKNGWSRSQVLLQFKTQAYERSLIEPSTTSITKSDDITNKLFKDTYVFDFIDRNNILSERDLENSLINNINKFLLELGKGFSYIGNQYNIKYDNKEYYIDLLFYNYIIHSFVVIELKLGEFKPDYIGQLIFYVNAVDDTLKSDIDNPTIGILLCGDASKLTVLNTLKGTILPLGVAKYKFIEELPEYLQMRLNAIKKGKDSN